MPKVMLRSDTFSAGAGPFDSTWTQQASSGTVNYDGSGNATPSATNTEVFAFDNLNVYPDDQYSAVQIGAIGSNRGDKVTTRASGTGSASDCYRVSAEGSGLQNELWRVDNESQTSLLNLGSIPWVSGDWMELQSIGNDHEVLRNDASIGLISDTTYPSGSAGLGLYGSPLPTIQAWEGGYFSSAPTITRSRKLSTQQRMVG